MFKDYELKLKQLKQINFPDLFIKGNFCDAMDETKNWCVAEVIEKNENIIKIHFEGWSAKHDEIINLGNFQKNKVAPFRKHSKLYTGQKKTAFRHYQFSQNDSDELSTLLKQYSSRNFNFYKVKKNNLKSGN